MTDLKTILRAATRSRVAATAVPTPRGSDDCANPIVKPSTKAARVEALLRRRDGASLAQLCEATDWQPHSCRAFLAGLRKKGRSLKRQKREDGTTVYRLASESEAS